MTNQNKYCLNCGKTLWDTDYPYCTKNCEHEYRHEEAEHKYEAQ